MAPPSPSAALGFLVPALVPWCFFFSLREPERRVRPSTEYQAFVDHLPISEFPLDAVHEQHFGRTRAFRFPRLFDLFDWLVDVKNLYEAEGMHRVSWGDPSTVAVGPHAVEQFMADIKSRQGGFELPRHRNRSLVIIGSSWSTTAVFGAEPLRRAERLAELQVFFAHIWMLGRDVDVQGIKTLPTGLSEHYLRPTTGYRNAELAVAAITGARLETKTGGVLAAFGKATDSGDCTNGPLDQISELGPIRNTTAMMLWFSALPAYSRKQTIAECHILGQVAKIVSRLQARRWLESRAAEVAGVEWRSVEPLDWWRELAMYRFLLSPTGDGLQSPKMVEALLVLTIPIVQRGAQPVNDDLARMGVPLAIVDEWEEVTHPRLSEWWGDLSPRLKSFRRNCLTTEAYWRIITGRGHVCH